ncbi:MAG: sigma-70 family RNA polymerase sigma factor [Candidatus Poribacteria bacterium]|nr:sigma-70 family RNA polymerase sigma factor [Candidatus Poribacteria bacterium]
MKIPKDLNRGDFDGRETDVQLIHSTLSGNDEAFSTLVRNYQKSIHALAWRKVGDFHIAEEITQDTFLQAYRNLAQLKNPNQFAGWIYVIANRLCLKRLQEKTFVIPSLEDTPMEEVDKFSYTRYVSEQRESETTEHRHELVKKLLAKLPESERTVVTLHYFGEMTTKEIGKFLGVSVNTIKSRLRRGIKRLQKQGEESLVRETLGGIQFPVHVTERIMQQVAEISPTVSPPVGKPLLPWAAFGTAVVFVLLMIGVSNQILARFQRPYSFEAKSEQTIEIVDASIVLDIPAKPAMRNQFGQAAAPGKSSGVGTQVSDVTPTSVSSEDSTTFSTSQWTQGKGPPAGYIRDLFATSEGTVYAVASTGIYRLSADETTWIHVDASVRIGESRMPMAAHAGSLYIVSTDEIFTSDNNGETWTTLGPRPKGDAVGLVITDTERASTPQVPITMYLALKDKGIFRSTDGGTQWNSLKDGLTVSEKISAVAAVGKTVFAGTENGLYRLDSGTWEKLPLDTSGAVCSLAVSGNNLYVGVGPDPLVKLTSTELYEATKGKRAPPVKIFHSADLGDSWTEIRHGSKHSTTGAYSGITVLATGETLLALSYEQSRSTDGGQTWTQLKRDQNWVNRRSLPAVIVNEKTSYKASVWGIHRTTDGGESWHLFMNGVTGTFVTDLVAFNNRLYAHSGYEVYQSTDAGVSWKKVRVDGQAAALNPRTKLAYESKLVVANNTLYFLSSEAEDFQIFRLSTDGDMLIPVQGVPLFDRKTNSSYTISRLQIDAPYAITRLQGETATTSGEAFYVEYQRGLFKWKIGDPEWTYTGLADTSQGYNHWNSGDYRGGFKMAVSGETVYVGQRDGKLFQSLDEGGSWRDLTPSLPLRFTHFKDIAFIGSILYVSTDEGVLASQTGEHWRVLTDSAGARPVIDRFATDGIKVYGIGDAGIYCLDTRRQWKKISSEVIGDVISTAIIKDRFYSAVNRRGIFHISVEE